MLQELIQALCNNLLPVVNQAPNYFGHVIKQHGSNIAKHNIKTIASNPNHALRTFLKVPGSNINNIPGCRTYVRHK